LFRFTVEQYCQLDELGVFGDRHVELIEGILYEMTINPPHVTSTLLVVEALRSVFGDGWVIRLEKPLEAGRRSLPEPDVSVVAGTIRDFATRHPASASLIIEVGDSTLRKDRTLKAHLYAQAGIADYWIVNLNDRQVEVHRDPRPNPARKGRFLYREITVIPAEGHVSPLAKPDGRISVADVLP
jgi:Uma2 family endonuclease